MVKQTRVWATAALLSFFVGSLGIDRFYLGCIGTGILKLLTAGGLGVWTLIDFVRILAGSTLCGVYRYADVKQTGGGLDNDLDNVYILISLLLGAMLLYYVIYPWYQRKYMTQVEEESD